MVLRREIQKHESFRSLGLILLRFPLLVRTSFDNLKKIRSLVLFIILKQESKECHDVVSSRRRNVATLGRSLTFTTIDQTSRRAMSRHWNVTTLARRDVAAGFPLLLRIYIKLLKTTIFTCNEHKIQKSDVWQ